MKTMHSIQAIRTLKVAVLFICFTHTISGCQRQEQADQSLKSESVVNTSVSDTIPADWSKVSEEDWRARLTAEEYRILRKKGTERAFTGDLWNNKEDGIYTCAGCGLPLFDSKTKFRSGTGWPSYYAPINSVNVASEKDESYGMVRTEVLCSRCGGHLGHVFNDGPKPTGLRYCINSASLDFVRRDSTGKK